MRKLIALSVIMLAVLTVGCGGHSQPVPAEQDSPPAQTLPPPDAVQEPEYGEHEDEYDFYVPEIEAEDAEPPDIEQSPYAQEEPDVGVSEDIAPAQRPMIALTFDDGPSRYTEYILDLLERYGGRATFFVLGSRIEQWRDTVVRAAAIGSEIAGHTWSHRDLTRLSEQQIAAEIQKTSEAIKGITGFVQRFYRPPYGLMDERVKNISADLGYALILWTVDVRDWAQRCADTVYEAIMNQAQENAVILLHDIHPTTAEAMERVIPGLIAEGYRLVTVTELLTNLYDELEKGNVYGRRG